MSVVILKSVQDRIECMRIRPLLQPFLDGQLDDGQRERVNAHLEACRRCGLSASTYRSIKARLRRSGRPVDPDAVDRLQAFVDQLVDDEGDRGRPAGPGGP